jgi:hypothetical protein
MRVQHIYAPTRPYTSPVHPVLNIIGKCALLHALAYGTRSIPLHSLTRTRSSAAVAAEHIMFTMSFRPVYLAVLLTGVLLALAGSLGSHPWDKYRAALRVPQRPSQCSPVVVQLCHAVAPAWPAFSKCVQPDGGVPAAGIMPVAFEPHSSRHWHQRTELPRDPTVLQAVLFRPSWRSVTTVIIKVALVRASPCAVCSVARWHAVNHKLMSLP